MALPRTVREQDRRADELWKQQYQSSDDDNRNPEDDTVEDDDPERQQANGQSEAAETAAPQQQESSDDEQGSDYWKQRFNVLQGKYNSEIRQLSEANRELKQRDERNSQRLTELEQSLQEHKRNQPVDLSEQFSKEELEEFGPDTLQLVHRTANRMAEQMAEQIRGEFRQDVEQVRQTTQQSEEQRFWDTLDASLPEWRRINDDQAFHAWLAEEVPVHTDQGIQHKPRQSLLDSYASGHNTRAVIGLFKQFAEANQGERGSAREQREVPPRRGSGSTQQPPPQGEAWVSRDDIRDFYHQKAKWERRDPEACRAREREIERAVASGRVRD